MTVLDRLVALGIFCLAIQLPLEVREPYPERVSIREISKKFTGFGCAYLWTTRMDAFTLDASRRGDQQSEFARRRNIGGAARGAQDVSLPPRPSIVMPPANL